MAMEGDGFIKKASGVTIPRSNFVSRKSSSSLANLILDTFNFLASSLKSAFSSSGNT